MNVILNEAQRSEEPLCIDALEILRRALRSSE
jgi:hypothetical protein